MANSRRLHRGASTGMGKGCELQIDDDGVNDWERRQQHHDAPCLQIASDSDSIFSNMGWVHSGRRTAVELAEHR